MHRSHLALFAALLTACACSISRGTDLPGTHLVDLTHAFDEDTIYWPTAARFEFVIDSRGRTEGGYWYEANTIRTAEHGGTHLDAPVHFSEGRNSSDEIPLERLIAPAVVVDVTAVCASDRDHQVRVAELEAFEAEHGPIAPGTIVLLRTGFGAHWPDAERYLGTAERGAEAALRLSFPGLHPSAARWLVQREVAAVGIDTASIDHGKSRLFHAHRELFRHDIPAFENVANLHELPATGATVIALPMKIRRGSGGPLRIVATW